MCVHLSFNVFSCKSPQIGDFCLPLPIICIASSVSLYYCMVEIRVEQEASNNLFNNKDLCLP